MLLLLHLGCVLTGVFSFVVCCLCCGDCLCFYYACELFVLIGILVGFYLLFISWLGFLCLLFDGLFILDFFMFVFDCALIVLPCGLFVEVWFVVCF